MPQVGYQAYPSHYPANEITAAPQVYKPPSANKAVRGEAGAIISSEPVITKPKGFLSLFKFQNKKFKKSPEKFQKKIQKKVQKKFKKKQSKNIIWYKMSKNIIWYKIAKKTIKKFQKISFDIKFQKISFDIKFQQKFNKSSIKVQKKVQ